jgi:glucose 1-dehydrogenase
MTYQPLKGQKALVTGASSGIGEGVARALGAAGADVVVNFVTMPETAERVASEIRGGGVQAIAIHADVSREADVQAMFRRMLGEWGTIDILVNNAGLQRDAAFTEMTLEQWNAVIAVNLTGMFLCSREAAREMARRGIRPEVSRAAGKILCVSSVHELIPWAGHINYAASKGGVHAFMQSAALKALLTLIPYGRIGQPEDIGRAAVWLASDDSDYVHGQTLFVDGGMTLYPEFARGG